MKTVLQLDAGVLDATMKRLTARLRTSLGAALLRPLLLTPTRVSMPQIDAVSPATLTIPTATSPRRKASMTSATPNMRVVSRKAPLLTIRAASATPKLAQVLISTSRPSSLATAAPPSRTAANRLSIPRPRRAELGKSVIGPVAPGTAARMPSLSAVARALTSGHSPARRATTRAAAIHARPSRTVPLTTQTGQISKPASALATHKRRTTEVHSQSNSTRPTSDRLSGSSTSRAGREGGRNGRGVDDGHDSGEKIALSGDLVIDGRRLGELALNSVARSGSSAQTGARNPNFRRNALPSGLSAPLP